MKSLIAALLLATPMLAHAYTWDQTTTFAPNTSVSSLNTYTFTQDLTLRGFDASTDSISSYQVTIDLHTANDSFSLIYVNQPGLTGDSLSWLLPDTSSLLLQDSDQGLASINKDGLLNISLLSIAGTFYLDSSTITATGTQGSSDAHSVPEPASIALLAAGLIGITVMRRHSKKTS